MYAVYFPDLAYGPSDEFLDIPDAIDFAHEYGFDAHIIDLDQDGQIVGTYTIDEDSINETFNS